MKYKMVVLILTLAITSLAQTTTPTAPSTPQQGSAEKAKCPCCDKMAAGEAKNASACCAHHDMNAKDGKEMSSCCAGKKSMSGDKDAMSCMRNAKDTAASCCKQGCSNDSCAKDKTASACCGSSCGKDGKGCCAKKAEKAAKSCCKEELQS
jgi:hypothetical protein